MANSSLSRQIKRLGTPRRFALILLGSTLFALILFLEYTHSTKHGDLVGSIIYAIPFPGFLTASLLSLTTDKNEMRQIHFYGKSSVIYYYDCISSLCLLYVL
jgi:hypothetical protein